MGKIMFSKTSFEKILTEMSNREWALLDKFDSDPVDRVITVKAPFPYNYPTYGGDQAKREWGNGEENVALAYIKAQVRLALLNELRWRCSSDEYV